MSKEVKMSQQDENRTESVIRTNTSSMNPGFPSNAGGLQGISIKLFNGMARVRDTRNRASCLNFILQSPELVGVVFKQIADADIWDP
jgi:hypothetical protein